MAWIHNDSECSTLHAMRESIGEALLKAINKAAVLQKWVVGTRNACSSWSGPRMLLYIVLADTLVALRGFKVVARSPAMHVGHGRSVSPPESRHYPTLWNTYYASPLLKTRPATLALPYAERVDTGFPFASLSATLAGNRESNVKRFNSISHHGEKSFRIFERDRFFLLTSSRLLLDNNSNPHRGPLIPFTFGICSRKQIRNTNRNNPLPEMPTSIMMFNML